MEGKRYRCLVSFQGYNQKNIFHVQSPTGKIISLSCNSKWDDMSQDLQVLITKYQFPCEYKNIDWSRKPIFVEMLSHEMMSEILALSKQKR